MQPPRSMTVHPHTRGEHQRRHGTGRAHCGSSPHPWGTPAEARYWSRSLRFIPTPVGNTAARHHHRTTRPVHPHTRGEHQNSTDYAQHTYGSSPHPWGTHPAPAGPQDGGRFIPTPVGNTGRRHLRQRQLVGSSPHPWGTPGFHAPSHGIIRFIPTPVGNTAPQRYDGQRRAVHPHTRGEHFLIGNQRPLPCGSSPHPWGTRRSQAMNDRELRFIPTPVGNTLAGGTRHHSRTVHPHTRGEHCQYCGRIWSATGSSPHPWGTREGLKYDPDYRRFIPTPVGNTRGLVGWFAKMNGSSPHPWGTLEAHQARLLTERFIPTPVGNTGRARARCARPSVHPHTRGEHHSNKM